MDQKQANAKWQSTIDRLAIQEKDCYKAKNGLERYKSSGIVKSNLRVAVHYLVLMDRAKASYTVPFDRDKFSWLLREPVGKSKIDESDKIKHQCAKMWATN